jgi:hypothetical protein
MTTKRIERPIRFALEIFGRSIMIDTTNARSRMRQKKPRMTFKGCALLIVGSDVFFAVGRALECVHADAIH